jgi:hypothetical protein
VREVTGRFLEAGITPVHENCMNYGGMSWRHALELLDKVDISTGAFWIGFGLLIGKSVLTALGSYLLRLKVAPRVDPVPATPAA